MMRNLFYSLVLILALFYAAPAHADITIALVAPLTGNYAVFGEQLRHGTLQAVEDINAKGGVLGEKIILKEFDDACDPKQAVAVANQIASENISFVVGHFCSGAGIAAEKVFMENEILIISPAVSLPQFTDDADTFVFRLGLRTDLQGKAIGDYILKYFKDKKIAILNDKSSYGQFLATNVKSQLNAAGKEEILFDSFTSGEKDYGSLVTLLKQVGAQVLVVGGYHTETGLIARQLADQGVKLQIIGGGALMTDELWTIAGKYGEGILMTFGPDPRTQPQAKEALISLKRAGYEPEGFTIYAYSSVQALAQGIEKAKSETTRNVAAALRSHTYPTALGTITFDAKGDIQKPDIVMYQWHNGTYTQLP